jgi:hypothetical protein
MELKANFYEPQCLNCGYYFKFLKYDLNSSISKITECWLDNRKYISGKRILNVFVFHNDQSNSLELKTLRVYYKINYRVYVNIMLTGIHMKFQFFTAKTIKITIFYVVMTYRYIVSE